VDVSLSEVELGAMAGSLDELMRFLLDEIALSGQLGESKRSISFLQNILATSRYHRT
jgi:hypothetical protein